MSFCFLFFGYLGVPVPFSLMAGVFVGAIFTDVSLAAIVQKIFDGVDSEALLAIPFFLLVGELMSSANVVVRIANLSLSLVGHIRGGLSQVVVVFSMFFSEMSGSTTADVAVMSRALGGPMKREGYKPAFIAAIIASASTIAALVPPSITARSEEHTSELQSPVHLYTLSLHDALPIYIRGGLSQVVVVFSMFFSEMSGSTTADVAVMSRALGGPMKREGYKPAFIAAIIASASTIAALVPPSITAVVYGAVGNVSIAGLF